MVNYAVQGPPAMPPALSPTLPRLVTVSPATGGVAVHPDHVKAFHKDPEGYWDCLTAHDPDVLGTPRHVPHQAEIRAHASDFTPKLMNYASQLVKLQQGRGTSGASEDIVAELGDVVGQLKTRRSARFTRMLKELQSHEPQPKKSKIVVSPIRKAVLFGNSYGNMDVCLCKLRSEGLCMACRPVPVVAVVPASTPIGADDDVEIVILEATAV